eukprot:PhM_4_TR14731/c0_g1_i2/m.66504
MKPTLLRRERSSSDIINGNDARPTSTVGLSAVITTQRMRVAPPAKPKLPPSSSASSSASSSSLSSLRIRRHEAAVAAASHNDGAVRRGTCCDDAARPSDASPAALFPVTQPPQRSASAVPAPTVPRRSKQKAKLQSCAAAASSVAAALGPYYTPAASERVVQPCHATLTLLLNASSAAPGGVPSFFLPVGDGAANGDVLTEARGRLRMSLDLAHLKQVMRSHGARCPILPEHLDRLADYYRTTDPVQDAFFVAWLRCWGLNPTHLVTRHLPHIQRQRSPCCAAAAVASGTNSVLRSNALSIEFVVSEMVKLVTPSLEEISAVASPTSLLSQTETVLGIHSADATALSGWDLVDLVVRFVSGRSNVVDDIACENDVDDGEDQPRHPTREERKSRCAAAAAWLETTVGLPPSKARDVCCAAMLRLPMPSTSKIGLGTMARIVSTHFPRTIATRIVRLRKEFSYSNFTGFADLVNSPNTAVVLHLPNHYALCFGVHTGARAVLTARKGQLPRDWIPWSELLDMEKRRKCGLALVLTSMRQAC